MPLFSHRSLEQQPHVRAPRRQQESPHGRSTVDRPPLAGWLIGVVIGLGISVAACRWLAHATHNSRLILPAIEFLNAGTRELAIEHLERVKNGLVFDRLLERQELRQGLEGLIVRMSDVASREPATATGVP